MGDVARRHHHGRAVRSHAVRFHAAVLELAVGVGLPERVAVRASARRASGPVSARPRAGLNQTDNSTAATHRIPDGKSVEADGGKRPFNEEYLALMRHFGMTARTTAIGAKEQNGDVEASNGAIKRRLEQALLVRGHRDFESVSAWEEFVQLTLRKANERRGRRVADELAAMRPLVVARLAEFTEEDVTVSEWSTIRIRHNSYSVPSRLIEQTVRVRLFEDRIEVWFADKLQLSCERLRGRKPAPR
ncbi:MAG: hypothetical protein IPM79_04480 [Polyangiaceae bacterium]|nr:hypothetical protein [Polyangiaceae bacterium]